MRIVTESSTLTIDRPRSDRRRGMRLVQNRPVKIYDPSSARYVAGRTQDVSPSGLRLELPVSSPLLPGRLVHVHVGVSAGAQGLAQRSGMIPARVVWIDRSSGDGSMTAGFELVARVAVMDAA
jgi:hypothetical protein